MTAFSRGGVGGEVKKDVKNSFNTCELFDLIGSESGDSVWMKWSFTDWLIDCKLHFIVFFTFCYKDEELN